MDYTHLELNDLLSSATARIFADRWSWLLCFLGQRVIRYHEHKVVLAPRKSSIFLNKQYLNKGVPELIRSTAFPMQRDPKLIRENLWWGG